MFAAPCTTTPDLFLLIMGSADSIVFPEALQGEENIYVQVVLPSMIVAATPPESFNISDERYKISIILGAKLRTLG